MQQPSSFGHKTTEEDLRYVLVIVVVVLVAIVVLPDVAPYFFTFHMRLSILLNARKHGTFTGSIQQTEGPKTIKAFVLYPETSGFHSTTISFLLLPVLNSRDLCKKLNL